MIGTWLLIEVFEWLWFFLPRSTHESGARARPSCAIFAGFVRHRMLDGLVAFIRMAGVALWSFVG